MASTRNKNTPGNYHLEQWSKQKINNELHYTHQPNGKSVMTNHPGDGLLTGKIASCNLSKNFVDIESSLFGIGSTNLVNPLPPIKPDIYDLKSLNVIEKQKIFIPEPLTVQSNQRPMYLN